jgi:hypothetical protein
VPAVPFEYAIVRIVPRVERDEHVNAGVVVYAPTRDFLDCRIHLDRTALLGLDPRADLDAVATHLAAFEGVCRGSSNAGPIAALPLRERYHWLVAPRSTVLQTSPIHAGLTESLEPTLEHLFTALVLR